ncbi:MAG: EFR1 family ferrodoxin [Candidatus Hodarchaeota archaeon]
MKTTIYFFTGTGNSLKIAKDLVERLEDSELVPIAKVWEMEKIESMSDNVGFIFPLYYSGLPKIVYDFLIKVDLSKSNYFFTIITSTGDINEQPIQQLGKILESKSKKLNAGFYITMPNNYIIGFNAHPEEKQKEFFDKATREVENVFKIVKNEKNNITQDILEKDVSRSEKVNQTFREEVHESDKSFLADDNCNSCGLCADVCPVNNIKIKEGKPQWQHKCQLCLACINFCPEEAIQFERKTLNTGRYHHPEITLQEIINQKK